MEIVLARHAQPDWYPSEGYMSNPPLTELGFLQAELLGEHLATEHFDHILVSPLLRARQTVAPLLKRLGREEVVADWLEEIREPDYWNGWSREQVAAAYAEEDAVSIDERWRGVTGGEPIREFGARIQNGLVGFLEEHGIVHHDHEVPTWTVNSGTTAERANGPRVLMVAHGGTNGVVSERLVGAPPSPWPWFRIGYQHTTVGRFHARPTNGVLTFMMTGLETHHLTADQRTA
jgi:2,3-bisphosphoglycerate-dependent phosphoglycerate mutase